MNTNNISPENCVILINLSQILCNFKGEFQSATAPKEAPFSPAPLPPDSESTKMAYIWVTDYILNTAGLVYQDAGILNQTVTPSMVSYFSYNTQWQIFCFRQLWQFENSWWYRLSKKNVRSEKHDRIFYLVETKHTTRKRQDFII